MAQPTVGNITTSNALTFSHDNNKAGVLVLAGFGYWDPAMPDAVTFNGDALTLLGERTSDSYTEMQAWWIAAADAGANNVVLNNMGSSPTSGSYAAISLDDVSAFDTLTFFGGNGSAAIDAAVASMTANDLAFSAVVIRDLDDGNQTATVSGTDRYNHTAQTGGLHIRHRGQTGTGTGTVTLTTTPSESVFYTGFGVRIIGSGGGGGGTKRKGTVAQHARPSTARSRFRSIISSGDSLIAGSSPPATGGNRTLKKVFWWFLRRRR